VRFARRGSTREKRLAAGQQEGARDDGHDGREHGTALGHLAVSGTSWQANLANVTRLGPARTRFVH
jgi:hypothetical protein